MLWNTLIQTNCTSPVCLWNFPVSGGQSATRITDASSESMKNRTKSNGFGFFPDPDPDKKPEEIKPEQIFVNRSSITENTGQENPLTKHPDILVQTRDDGQQVPDRTVSGRCLSIRYPLPLEILRCPLVWDQIQRSTGVENRPAFVSSGSLPS